METIRLQGREPHAVQAHAAANAAAAARPTEATTVALQHLARALESAADISAFNRTRSPQRSRDLLESVEAAFGLLDRFAGIYGLAGLELGSVERRSWRGSVKALARQTGSTITSTAQAVPGKISQARDETVLKKARAIEAKRQEQSTHTADTEAGPGL